MSVLSRGARVRRGGRRPGWLLLTALLVLAIAASSALVFTNRVELLKLAVILALWAAVVAAFVSVIYRRQSDVDQARVRDLKLVYDLQLDREISARREYELTVESQLRRELASELRAQAADEVAALRAELGALRTSLEILFETELAERPALETDRAAHGYGQWPDETDNAPADWVSRNRVTSVRAERPSNRAEETSIIDVPEEPVPRQPTAGAADAHRGAEAYQRTGAFEPGYQTPEASGGAHWRAAEDSGRPDQVQPEGQRRRRARHPDDVPGEPRYELPDESRSDDRGRSPQPQPEAQRIGWYPPAEPVQPSGAGDWQPVGTERRWDSVERPDGVAANSANVDAAETGGAPVSQPSTEAPATSTRRGRHYGPDEDAAQAAEAGFGPQRDEAAPPAQARHSADYPVDGVSTSLSPESVSEPVTPRSMPVVQPTPTEPEPAARHRSAEPETEGPQTGGQSVAELLARLQGEPVGGGRRRRRAE